MANTIDSALITTTRLKVVINELDKILAPLTAFATLIPCDQGENPALATVAPIVKNPPETQVGTIDWENGDTEIDSLSMAAPTLYAQTFGGSPADLNNGFTDAMLFTANIRKFARTLSALVLGQITEANFGAAVVTSSALNWNESQFSKLFGSLSVPNRSILLSTDYFAKVRDAWLPPGFTNVRESDLTGVGTDIAGFNCSPEALVIRHGLPLKSQNANRVEERQVLTLPGIALPIEFCAWYKHGTKEARFSLACYLTAKVADPTALKLLKA